ncbi:hypothetical protein AOLI_G00000440 [Acnodon oligacanthus]
MSAQRVGNPFGPKSDALRGILLVACGSANPLWREGSVLQDHIKKHNPALLVTTPSPLLLPVPHWTTGRWPGLLMQAKRNLGRYNKKPRWMGTPGCRSILQ